MKKIIKKLSNKQELNAWKDFFDDWKKEYDNIFPEESFSNKNCWLMHRFHHFNAAWIGFKEGYLEGLNEKVV